MQLHLQGFKLDRFTRIQNWARFLCRHIGIIQGQKPITAAAITYNSSKVPSALVAEFRRAEATTEDSPPPPEVPVITIRSAEPGRTASFRRKKRIAALASTTAAGALLPVHPDQKSVDSPPMGIGWPGAHSEPGSG